MKRINLFTLLIIFLLLSVSTKTKAYYEIIDLGTVAGSSSSFRSWAYSINNNGEIVGFSETNSFDYYYRACSLDSSGNGNNVDLGALEGYRDSKARSVNENGQIVGNANNGNEYTNCRATLFGPNGTSSNIDLGTLPDCAYSEAWSNNNSGQIVGWASNSSGTKLTLFRAALFDQSGDGNNIDLGTLGGDYGRAYSINDYGQIVGVASDSLDDFYATLFDASGDGNNINLGTLPGYDYQSHAYCINNHGQIVGCAYDSGSRHHAALFDSSGNNIDLGTLTGYLNGSALSINDNGQIVGYSYDQSNGRCAALFDPTGNGNNIDLNTLIDPDSGWFLEYAYSINDQGWIVGTGINPDGCYTRGFLLTPEPATVLLFGLGGLLIRRRRK